MPSFDELKPFLVLGLALGGVFAMSGVGLVVLYRATGVLNLAYGAIGALGALITWSLLDRTSIPEWPAFFVCIVFGGGATLIYGLVFGPPFAPRDPLVKATATLGFLLILLGIMEEAWGQLPHAIYLPTSNWKYQVGGAPPNGVLVNWTQILGMAFPIIVTAGTTIYLRVTKTGTAMRALANDREITAMLGVPVRRVEAAAWFGSGLVCGTAGLLLTNLVGLDYVALTFLVIPALAAALIGQLRSLWITLAAGFVIGIVQSCLTAFSAVDVGPYTFNLSNYRNMTPFVLAIVALLWFASRQKQTMVRT
jgi:branched-chain amino acid transport system permease protein